MGLGRECICQVSHSIQSETVSHSGPELMLLYLSVFFSCRHKTVKHVFHVILAFAAFLGPAWAYADYYYGNSYGYSYGYHSGSRPSQIISLELDPKATLDTNLRVAAREDRLKDLSRFLRSGGNVNSRSDEGETALMYASRNCSQAVVRVLLQAHANENVRDNKGRTALIFAASDSCAPVVRILLKCKTLSWGSGSEWTHGTGLCIE